MFLADLAKSTCSFTIMTWFGCFWGPQQQIGDVKNRIGHLRNERGWSLADLAKAAGTTKSQIQKLERGDRRLTLDWMERLARGLNVPISDLLPEGEKTSGSSASDQKLIQILSLLDDEDRDLIVKLANGLLNKGGS